MSRNFELLRRVEMEQELLATPPVSARPAPTNGRTRIAKRSLVGEEEAKLVQRLFLSGSGALRLVVFCGVEHGHGAGSVCARASEVLAAQVPGRVCVVDANFSLPQLDAHFGVPSCPGLTDAVSDHGPLQSFIHPTSIANLWLISCGSKASDPRTLLQADRLQARLDDLRAQFDYILVSAPPAHLSADTITLGQLSNGVVLVLEANSTRREVAQKSKLTLETANVKLLGAVLNNRTFPIPKAIYSKL
jgi:capsular exopolysaccharide synthesis family protein